ncbi:MAG TPA: nuclear transport factor 2 family protein [Armatimonadota bacterium]|nr:nuclear transport factor 2 family protein [Armatimonadota bacterium]
MRSARLSILALGLCIGIAGGAGAAGSPEEQAVRARRLGLLKAVNAHNLRAVAGFVDPSFTGRTKDGQRHTYRQSIEGVREVFKGLPDFRERLTIERVVVTGDRADLTGTSIHTFTDPGKGKARVRQRTLQTWRKLRGRWMLVRERIL